MWIKGAKVLSRTWAQVADYASHAGFEAVRLQPAGVMEPNPIMHWRCRACGGNVYDGGNQEQAIIALRAHRMECRKGGAQ